MKCALITPVGPGHEKLFENSQESIRIAYETSSGPFSDVILISIDDTSGKAGRSAARNEGVRKATAEGADWLFFLDADDLLLPTAFECVGEYIDEYDAIWGMIAEMTPGSLQATLRSPQVSPIYSFEMLLDHDPFRTIQMGHFVKSSVALNEKFNESMNAGEDFDYYLRVWSQYKCIKIEEPLFINCRGQHSSGPRSANGHQWRIAVEEKIKYYRKNFIRNIEKSRVICENEESNLKNLKIKNDSKYYFKNVEAVKNRWPHIYKKIIETQINRRFEYIDKYPEPTLVLDNIHLSSGYAQKVEAQIQASLVPEESKNVWVYGVGIGTLPKEILRRKSLQKLFVVIMNMEVFIFSLCFFDHLDWICDNRVELQYGTSLEIKTPFCAVPSCLQLADEAMSRLRDLVVLELSTPYINEKHGINNSGILLRIKENELYVQGDGDVGSLFGFYPNSIIVVGAAGPSLSENFDWLLANRDKITLVSVNSSIKPLANVGIYPDIVVVIDGDPKIISCFQVLDLKPMAKVPLVYFPRVPSSVLALWPGPRLTAYADHPTYQDVAKKHPKSFLFSAGSVLHPSVDLAVKMGAKEIILLGADLAFPSGARYAQGAGWEASDGRDDGYWVLDGFGKRIPTLASFRGYLRDLEMYISKHKHVKWLNGSRSGARIIGTAYFGENGGKYF